MKYKVGDRVRIKSLDWYSENKDEYGQVNCGQWNFTKFYTLYCGKVMTIRSICEDDECYKMVNSDYHWTDEMIEGLVEGETLIKLTGKPIKNDEMVVRINEYALPEGYIFKDENGNVINATKIVLEKKKKEYPKTYEECLSILGIYNGLPDVEIYNAKPSECELFESLIRLKRCRDAYWKIYGEEMGLGKPWAPDWNDEKQDKYGFHDEVKYTIINSAIFVFPTLEMRDAFKGNFDPDIEICKELL